jgi:RHS repeat-associated protein
MMSRVISAVLLAALAALAFFAPPASASVRTPPAASLIMRSQYASTAFGENYVPGTNEAVPQRYQFAGRETSANATAGAPMFYRNRSYSPGLGRFGRRDPKLGGDSLYNAYGFSGSCPVTCSDPMGLCQWEKVEGKENTYRAIEDDASLEGLAQMPMVGADAKDWACLWPVKVDDEAKSREKYEVRKANRCDEYDVSNLTATRGSTIFYSFDPHLASNFTSLVGTPMPFVDPRDFPSMLALRSGEGRTPIYYGVVGGHGGVGGFFVGQKPGDNPRIATYGGIILTVEEEWWQFEVDSIVRLSNPNFDFNRASHKHGPLRCWFTRNAQMWFIGCKSHRDVSRSFAENVLRKGARAYGTLVDVGVQHGNIYWGKGLIPGFPKYYQPGKEGGNTSAWKDAPIWLWTNGGL